MLTKLTLLAVVVAAVYALPAPMPMDCPSPNNTDTKFHWYSCNTGAPITVKTMVILDDSGKPNYPIDIKKPLVLKTTSTLGGSKTYKMTWEDVKLYAWGGFLGCSWHTVPTFGLLDNIKQCGNCPISPGPLQLDYRIDLSPYAPIISGLIDGGVYGFDIHIKNGDDSNHEELGCISFQAKVKTS